MGRPLLKKRIIPVELLLNGRLVKTLRFDTFRDVGDPLKSSQVYSDQDADELILLNIDRGVRNTALTAAVLEAIAGACFMPIAVGGGVASVEDATRLFDAGADKVIVNSAAYRNFGLLEGIASRWGSQALVVSIDAEKDAQRRYAVRSDCARRVEDIPLDLHMRRVIDHGAGEVMINSVDQDGVMNGYDLELLELARAACSTPLIACGGAGHYLHLKAAFDVGVDAVACGSLFNFGDNNPLRAKSFLKNYQVPLKRI